MSLLHFRRVERRRTARATMCMNLLVYGETADLAAWCSSKRPCRWDKPCTS